MGQGGSKGGAVPVKTTELYSYDDSTHIYEKLTKAAGDSDLTA